jgi:hypothetical protein
MDLWERPPTYPIGLGATPDEAIADLYVRLDSDLVGTHVANNGWKSWGLESQDGTVCTVAWWTALADASD